jgi:hypothetical protein
MRSRAAHHDDVDVLAASFACLALKALGYAIPARWFGSARAERSIDLLTVALLAALVAVQTLGPARRSSPMRGCRRSSSPRAAHAARPSSSSWSRRRSSRRCVPGAVGLRRITA